MYLWLRRAGRERGLPGIPAFREKELGARKAQQLARLSMASASILSRAQHALGGQPRGQLGHLPLAVDENGAGGLSSARLFWGFVLRRHLLGVRELAHSLFI